MATRRIAFLDVPLPQYSPSAKVNKNEAVLIAEAVLAVYSLYQKNGLNFSPEETIGIIVPYRNQIAVVRREIEKRIRQDYQEKGKEEEVRGMLGLLTIDTVERYQGSERDVIIYGFTVQHEYQLDFLTNNTFVENGVVIDRKLNVAMTRAREQMLLLGNRQLLSRNAVFRKLIEQTV